MNRYFKHSLLMFVVMLGGGLAGFKEQFIAEETPAQTVAIPCIVDAAADANGLTPTTLRDGKQLWARSYVTMNSLEF